MASPQLENGHTRTANELLEAFCRINLSPYEGRVLRAIERKTYGYSKKKDRTSIRQISDLTGLDYRHVHRALSSLRKRNIITVEGKAGQTSIIGIQKDYDQWVKSTDAYTGDTSTGDTCIGDPSLDDRTVTYTGIGTVTSADDNKRKKKKKEKPPTDFSIFRQRYSDQSLIDRVFEAIASTRKNGKVADSVLLAQLKDWERYSVEQVEVAMRTYLQKDYAGQGKNEKYLLGIIRNGNKVQALESSAGKDWYEEIGAI